MGKGVTVQLLETRPRIVTRAAQTLPQGAPGQTAYFTVSAPIMLIQIVGEVTVEIGAGACNLKIVSNPTVGADNDMCANLDIDGDVVGTRYSITGDLSEAVVATTSGAMQAQTAGIVVPAGTIDLVTAANREGETKWVLHYIPLEDNAVVIVA